MQDILAVGLSPAIQKTLLFKQFREGHVNRSESYHMDSSGKCVNVCRVLTQGGAQVSCLTAAGRENRALFEELCRRSSLDIRTVETAGRVRTCTTILDASGNKCTELVVNEPEIVTKSEEEAFRAAFLEMISCGYRCLIISGSKSAGFSREIIPFMVRAAKERELLVFADYRGDDLKNSFISKDIRPDYVKINEEEFSETFGRFPSLKEGLTEISNRYECTFVISRGSDSTVGMEKQEFLEVESKRIKAVNPIGCGDAMTAGLAQGILEGCSLKESLEKGRDYAVRNALSLHPGWILN